MLSSNNRSARHAIIANLDIKIQRLEATIADLSSEKLVIEQARAYILSGNGDSSPNPYTAHSPAHTLQQRQPSSGSPSFGRGSSSVRGPSSLRHQAIIRSALQRGESPEQPGDSGLLASEDFDAAFNSDVNGTSTLEEPTRQVEKEPSAGTSLSPIMSRTTPNKETNAIRSPTRGKREKKRKLQANAARAREAKKKRLAEKDDEVMRDI